MTMEDWRQRAEALFFVEGKNIREVSGQVGVSVRSVSSYFNSLPHYAVEVKRRRAVNANRTEYYREHKRAYRAKNRYNVINSETMRAEQALAARILSRERHFDRGE